MEGEIDDVKNKNFSIKIKAEIDCLKNKEKTFGLNEMEIGERIELLESILDNKVYIRKETLSEKQNNMFKEISKDTYKKPWGKLIAFHKVVKLKEYVKEHYGEGVMQNEIVTKLSENINDGKINTKKFITYDPNAEKILALTCLEVNMEKGTYKINF
jgi:vancomycin resistance protein YoaR